MDLRKSRYCKKDLRMYELDIHIPFIDGDNLLHASL